MKFTASMIVLASSGAFAQVESFNPQHVPLPVESVGIEQMRVILNGSRRDGGYAGRDNCPVVQSKTGASFEGGTYTAQGGFAEGEIAAVSYTLPANMFPLKVTQMECIFAQSNATVQTTTQWSVLIWEGTPATGNLIAEFVSDGSTLPHIIMGPGTRGTNVQAVLDPNDPEQIYIYNNQNLSQQTFSVGFRIDQHNAQSADPCVTAPPSNSNAFPCTDNTTVGCGTGYSALNFPADNWLYALNCGPNGCPPNGGWTRFSNLQADQNLFGFCLTGCRPRGDWVMRVTVDPVNCPPPDGACCFGTFGCTVMSQAACQSAGGSWRGGGTTCGTQSNGQWPGCVVPPNQPPVANAGADQTVTDADGSGDEVVVVDASASTDSDGIITAFRWMRGATILQDGPAFLSTTLPVGVHDLTVTATDDDGATSTDTVRVTVNAGGPSCGWAGDGCYVDYNNDGGIDGDDVIAFFAQWDAASTCADVDNSGGVDGDDVILFFAQWDAAGAGVPGC
jgi:hypothetical protein